MPKIPSKKKVKASPTKAFFVQMITRDITLEDSILDLIDNSIDAAWKNEGGQPTGLAENVSLSKYKISIMANENQFEIKDNCGGMGLEDAIEYAFSFGRREDEPADDYSIGVYGIGMKRAVFKLGKKISIKSTVKDENGKKIGFEVPINVDEWMKIHQGPWDFDLDESSPCVEEGVVISATQLTDSTKASFEDPKFVQQLSRLIGRDYSLPLKQGLTIEVNGKKVEGWNITFMSGDEFKPARFSYKDEIDGEPVTVEIIGGMTEIPPDSLEPSEQKEMQDRYGWYIICNGRIVLAADKTEISGWGEIWPKWHPQYNGFKGLLIFSAKNASNLPLTTTKRNVDSASEVFRRARQKLEILSRAWIAYTHRRKIMNRGGDESQKKVRTSESAAKPVSVYEVQSHQTLDLPDFAQDTKGEKPANVSYSVPVSRARALAKGLGSVDLSYREIGLQSFDYAYNDLAE